MREQHIPPLPQTVDHTVSESPQEQAPTAPTRSAGSVPGYEIISELGRGGMGVVYKARQVGLNRVVALKMILAGEHAGPDDLARFRIEAQAIARLQHPNIVQIYEVGEDDALPYFSLEFCPEGSLEQKLNATVIPDRDAALLVEKLASALHAAHVRGVIHRDLKPANVLFAEDGAPKVTDFGLAKRLDTTGRTATGAIIGTPSYMSPEQASGDSKTVAPASDVYALGAVLYECLTGRPPFQGRTDIDTLLQVVSEDPIPPSRLRSKVPRDLETICLKCLNKQSASRYPSALAVAEDLCRFLNNEPIYARRTLLRTRAVKWVKLKFALLILFAAILCLIGAGYLAITAEMRVTREYERLVEDELAGHPGAVVSPDALARNFARVMAQERRSSYEFAGILLCLGVIFAVTAAVYYLLSAPMKQTPSRPRVAIPNYLVESLERMEKGSGP